MAYDLIVVKQKWYKNKIFIVSLVLLAIVILLSLTFFIVHVNRNSKNNISKISEKQAAEHVYNFNRNIEITDEIKNRMNNLYSSEEKRVFLTFDDGPSKKVTIPILDLLKQENIKATFFTLGSRIEFYPEIVEREYKEGHYVANHGYSHNYSSIYSSTNAVLDEYNKTEQLIKNAIGDQNYSSHLFRFPGGSKGGRYRDIKNETINVLNENNILYVDWNALNGDSEGKKTREEMMQYLKETIGNKQTVVILMHDAGDKTLTYEMLPEVIAYLREQGYSFKNFYDVIK